jgi:multisubunit Na+/H+ antiporter MnhE subunit
VASSAPEGEVRPAASTAPTRLRGSDAIRLHLTLAGGLALCIGAFIIELLRALGGHSFSWMYVFEWPLFAGFAIYMWWNLLQGNDRVPRSSSTKSSPQTVEAPVEGLDEWNLYLQVMEAAEGDDPARPA